MRRVRVVAAVIRRRGATLVTRRLDGAARGGKWEFPGGKVEPGEAEREALRREIREELGCGITVGPLLARRAHAYPDVEVELALYGCRLEGPGEPRPLGAAALAWAEPGTLSAYDFCEADRPVLDQVEGWSGEVEGGRREPEGE